MSSLLKLLDEAHIIPLQRLFFLSSTRRETVQTKVTLLVPWNVAGSIYPKVAMPVLVSLEGTSMVDVIVSGF